MATSREEAGLAEQQPPGRLLRLATAGVVAYSVLWPLTGLWRIAADPVDPTDPGLTVYAAAATACYLPLHGWLVWSSTREPFLRRREWVLVAVAFVILGMLPVLGVSWLAALQPLTAAVLLVVPAPWSLLLFAMLVAAPAPLAVVFGHPEWALTFGPGALLAAATTVVPVWLIRAARQLETARRTLARQAVLGERLRIDREVRRTVGAALEAITSTAERAGRSAVDEPMAAAEQVEVLAERSRRALADARHLLTRYQEVSVETELETAVTLLAAAGIQTRLEKPPGELTEPADEALRTALRRHLAHLLGDDTVRSCVLAVTRSNGLRLELRIDADDRMTIRVRA
jgi:hypothetical protein